MPHKFFGTDKEESSVFQKPEIWPDSSTSISGSTSALAPTLNIQVREPQKIPRKIREFFKVDLKTGTIHPHDPSHLITKIIDLD